MLWVVPRSLGEYLPVGSNGDQPVLGPDPIAMLDQTAVDRPYVPPNVPLAPTDTAQLVPAATGPQPPVPLQPAPSPRTGAGVGILLAGVATAAGAYVGGAYGAGAGLLLMGATRNLYRVKQLWSGAATDREEAMKSGTMALFGLGIGGWPAYKAYETRNGSDDE